MTSAGRAATHGRSTPLREAEGDERDRIYAERVAIAPGFGEYERQTSRKIPVMILERTT